MTSKNFKPEIEVDYPITGKEVIYFVCSTGRHRWEDEDMAKV